MAKRVYSIDIERRPHGIYADRDRSTYEYMVVAGNAEEAIRKARVAVCKDTGFSSPWFIKRLQDMGDAI